MASRLTALVLVAVLLVAGGCTGTESSAPTTAPQSDAATTSPAQTPTPTSTSSTTAVAAADRQTEGISIRSGNDSGSVVVEVRANTSLASSDPAGNNPGEPYFAVLVNGETVRETREVNRSAAGRYAFELDSSRFPQSGSGTIPVTVVLTDRDSVFDDEIARWSTSVDAATVSAGETGSTATPAAETSTVRTTRTPTTTAPSTTTLTTTTSTQTTTTATATTTTTPTATSASETGPGQSSYAVEVVEVIDGDTATIEFRNGSTADARFLGVDTPEVHTDNDPAEFEGVPATEAGADCLRDWGHKAGEFTRSELLGERVTVTFDSNEGRRGSYGRLLVYVHHDDELFNYELVTQGYARMYDSEFTKRSRFASAESSAQRDDVGLWECTDAESTTETTTASDSPSGGSSGGGDTDGSDSEGGDSDGAGSLAVAQIHADAPDNDHDNLNEEYMVFENTGDAALDLSGWVLEDAADHTYVFPDGFSLGPGETVTVYTGSGGDTDSELYWGSGSAVWNNGGDTIIVTNANGDVVLRREYSG